MLFLTCKLFNNISIVAVVISKFFDIKYKVFFAINFCNDNKLFEICINFILI